LFLKGPNLLPKESRSGARAPLAEEKILVIEALDRPCPYQGTMAPEAYPSYDPYEPFFTLDQLRTTVWTGPCWR